MKSLDKQGKLVLFVCISFFLINAAFILFCLKGTVDKDAVEQYLNHEYSMNITLIKVNHEYNMFGNNKGLYVYDIEAYGNETRQTYKVELKGTTDDIKKMSCTIKDEQGNLVVVKDSLGNIQHIRVE